MVTFIEVFATAGVVILLFALLSDLLYGIYGHHIEEVLFE